MTRAGDEPLSVFALLSQLLPGVALTSGQLAGVRAINTKFQTELFALGERARAAGRPGAAPSPAERRALRAMLVGDLRSVLTEAQRSDFDRRAGLRRP